MTTTNPQRDRLRTLLQDHAVIHMKSPPSSKRSSYYVDARQVLLDPEGAALAGPLLGGGGPRPHRAKAVGGLTLGADPAVCAASAAAWAAGERVTGFFVRKESKKHGLQQWIEGPFIEEGTPVAVIDDVLTSGGSLAVAIEARQAGGVVVAALVVIDQEVAGRHRGAPRRRPAVRALHRAGAPERLDLAALAAGVSGPSASVLVDGQELEVPILPKIPGGPPVAGDDVRLSDRGDEQLRLEEIASGTPS